MGEKEGLEEKEGGAKTQIKEFRNDPVIVLIEDVLISVAIVGGIAIVLYGISGIWPPMVAIESGSMEPNIMQGDIVFIVSPSNFVSDETEHVDGVVTRQMGAEQGYTSFGEPGDAIVFRPDGSNQRTAIIHRAEFYVEEGDEWTNTDGETEVAPHDGFVTKGDANQYYDQEQGLSTVVRSEWIEGKAKYRIPYVGNLRLLFPSGNYVPLDGVGRSIAG